MKFVSAEAEKTLQATSDAIYQGHKNGRAGSCAGDAADGSFPAYYAGSTFYNIMYDYNELKRCWIKFMDDFGDMDTFMGPGLIPSGRIMDALDVKMMKWPGHGLGKDVTMQQIVEGEYMKADEYDWLMMDPTDYNLRATMPRTAGVFEPFAEIAADSHALWRRQLGRPSGESGNTQGFPDVDGSVGRVHAASIGHHGGKQDCHDPRISFLLRRRDGSGAL